MSEEMRFRLKNLNFVSRKSDGSYGSETECIIKISCCADIEVSERDAKSIIKVLNHYLEES